MVNRSRLVLTRSPRAGDRCAGFRIARLQELDAEMTPPENDGEDGYADEEILHGIRFHPSMRVEVDGGTPRPPDLKRSARVSHHLHPNRHRWIGQW